ncbi:MAG: hypothetical protein ABH804_01970 [archaeon]
MNKDLKSRLLGRKGSPGEIAKNLKSLSGTYPLLKSKLKSRKISCRGYSIIPNSDLRNIFKSYRTRYGDYSIMLEGRFF